MVEVTDNFDYFAENTRYCHRFGHRIERTSEGKNRVRIVGGTSDYALAYEATVTEEQTIEILKFLHEKKSGSIIASIAREAFFA